MRRPCPPREAIVVVDHNLDLLALATAWLPGVRVVQNGECGASGGMNSGVAAGGDVVAFLDDDAVAPLDWLEQSPVPPIVTRACWAWGADRAGLDGRAPEVVPARV